jgi:hypothetical protein
MRCAAVTALGVTLPVLRRRAPDVLRGSAGLFWQVRTKEWTWNGGMVHFDILGRGEGIGMCWRVGRARLKWSESAGQLV